MIYLTIVILCIGLKSFEFFLIPHLMRNEKKLTKFPLALK